MSHQPSATTSQALLAWEVVAIAVAVLLVLLPMCSSFLRGSEEHAAETQAEASDTSKHHPDSALQPNAALPPGWWVGTLPFIAILLCIALLPLFSFSHIWWEENTHRLVVSLVCGLCTLAYYLVVRGPGGVMPVLEHAIVAEYVPFIVLLFSLYVISGGISLSGDLAAHPSTNTAFLAIGAALASFIGTTGASMLLIRPLLQTNSERRHRVHTVVFFIFLVSNIGGTLLPVGDPPLFLGYLKGVDFFWTLGLWREWLVCCGVLLVVYFCLDSYWYRRETARDIRLDEQQQIPLKFSGMINLLWLAGVVLAVAFVVPGKKLPGLQFEAFVYLRELLMLAFVGLSLLSTPRGVRERNRFNYAAILEVAALFLGIFICMQVPVEVLRGAGASLGLTQDWQYFWATGGLSAVLDNAPTYVVFFETANALTTHSGPNIVELGNGGGFIRADLLTGVSLGAVFMGAMTYIGNGPNFMVKAIAEQSGVRMPSFPGYFFKYSLPILVPLFAIVVYLVW